MKINWNNTPPEFKYAAKNIDGSVFVFTEKPFKVLCFGVWYCNGKKVYIGESKSEINWQNSLIERYPKTIKVEVRVSFVKKIILDNGQVAELSSDGVKVNNQLIFSASDIKKIAAEWNGF